VKCFYLTIALALFSGVALAQEAPNPESSEPLQDATRARLTFETSVSEIFHDTVLSPLNGNASFEISSRILDGNTTQWTEVRADFLRWNQIPLGSAKATLREHAQGPGADLNASIQTPFFHANVSLDGNFQIDPLTRKITLKAGPIDGTFNIEMTRFVDLPRLARLALTPRRAQLSGAIKGTTSKPIVTAKLVLDGLNAGGRVFGDVVVDWERDDSDTVRASLIGSSQPRLSVEWKGKIDLDLLGLRASWDRKAPMDLSISGRLSDREFRPFFSVNPALKFDLDVDTRLQGTLTALKGHARLTGPLTIGPKNFPASIEVLVNGARQTWMAKVEEWFHGDAISEIQLDKVAEKDLSWIHAPITGSVALDVEAKTLQPLSTSVARARGKIQGEIQISGTLDGPLLQGDLELLNGGFTWIALNRRVQPLSGNLEFVGETANLTVTGAARASELAPGILNGTGVLRIPRLVAREDRFDFTTGGDFHAEIVELPWVQRYYPLSTVSAELDIGLKMTRGQTDIHTQLQNASIRVSAERLPTTGNIPMNPDIVVIDASGKQTQKRSPLAGSGFLRLHVELLNPMTIEGQGNNFEITGAMTLERTDDEVLVEGGFEPRGTSTFMLFENQMELRHGIITLTSGNLREQTRLDARGAPQAAPLEPMVELVAHGDVDNTVVMVRLEGPLSRPALTLRAQPPIPEYEIISLLVTGRADAVDSRNGNVRKAAQELVERYHNPSLQRQLFARIGIDKLGFGFGSSVTNPILTVGKQLTRNLYVETVYHHGAPPDANMMEGRVEQRLDRRWTLNTAFGDAAEGRFGVFWGTRFGAPPPPEVSEDEWNALNTFSDRRPVRTVNPETTEDVPLTFVGVKNLQGAVVPITFAKNQTRPDDRETLLALAALLNRYPFVGVTISGHSDTLGEPDTKMRVSVQRAETVARELGRLGIAPDRITARGFGDSTLLVEGDSDEANAQNRRVEVALEYLVPEAS